MLHPPMLDGGTIIKNFQHQWKALKERKKEGLASTPKESKTLAIIKWSKVFAHLLNIAIGARNVILSCVGRVDDSPSGTLPPLAPNSPHSEKYVLAEVELLVSVPRDHPLFKDDNAKVSWYLEEAARSTQREASIKTYGNKNNGRYD